MKLIFTLMLLSQFLFANTLSIEGKWLTEEKDGEILIHKVGESIEGIIVGGDKDKEKLDVNNPDPKLRTRELLGSKLMWGFKAKDKEKLNWVDGEIYDPNNGKTYSCKLKLEGDKLHIRGFIGISLFGRTTVWTRIKN